MGKYSKPQPDAACCVIGCVNHEFISDDERFYRFPNDVQQRKGWIDAVSRINGVDANGVPWMPDRDSIICCYHFFRKYKSKNPMSDSYLPTIFMPVKRPIDSSRIRINNESIGIETQTTTAAEQLPKIYAQTVYPFGNKKEIKLEFIDHVVLGYLNRCRSRAGRINIGMPHYMLKDKAEQAAVLLGTKIGCRFQWFDKFKKFLAQHDTKEIVLTQIPQSLIVADIMIDEWPKFAKLKGLDIGDDSEESVILVNDEENILQTEDVMMTIDSPEQTHIQNVDLTSDRSRSISPVIEVETNIQATISNIHEGDSQDEFLRHVLMVFIKRFSATFPQGELPDTILKAKCKEAALFLGCSIKKSNQWISAYKRNLLPNCSTESISAEPNQSLNMSDIIEEERPKFYFQNDGKTQEQSRLEEVVSSETIVQTEQINGEHFDGIQVETYEEARGCLQLLNNYALEQGDYDAFSLITQIDKFLRSEECKY